MWAGTCFSVLVNVCFYLIAIAIAITQREQNLILALKIKESR